jgi:hypothetical protein
LCARRITRKVLLDRIAKFCDDLSRGSKEAAEEKQMADAAAVARVKRQLPLAGDRVGSVCGPGESPRDSKGTVLCITENRWYSNIAQILWDDGTTDTMVGAYTTVGIGVYRLNRRGVA